MPFSPTVPYNELAPLPPTVEIETAAVLKKCIAASRALAELKGAGDLIPNQAILINAIPLQEAKLSSEIENIVTTQDELYKAAIDTEKLTDPQTKEVLRYRAALRYGSDALAERVIDLDLIAEICSILRGEPTPFRTSEQVYVGNPAKGIVIYTPPVGAEVVRTKLRNLEAFTRDSGGLDPLVQMAVLHYQFEAIHPFVDGNGRTGRILNLLLLLQGGLLQIPVMYLSRYIIDNKLEYYRGLRAVTEERDWERWLLFMLSAVEETARWTTGRIFAIRNLFEATLERARAGLPPRIYSHELIEAIFIQPYCKIQVLVEAGIAKRQTASGYLKALEDLGILASERSGREVIYKHPALLAILGARD
jgi:Fic family protein